MKKGDSAYGAIFPSRSAGRVSSQKSANSGAKGKRQNIFGTDQPDCGRF